jgi:hypothetical protein
MTMFISAEEMIGVWLYAADYCRYFSLTYSQMEVSNGFTNRNCGATSSHDDSYASSAEAHGGQ